MNSSLWEKISSKYLLKSIFSYLKVPTTLKIIKASKKIQNILDISLFHYQYYCFFGLFRILKIETTYDIINSSYLKIFPEDKKYELISKFIENRKLFADERVYLKIDDNESISFIQNLKKKQINTSFNYLIGNIEYITSNKYLYETSIDYYHKNILNIIQMNKLNDGEILFDHLFFSKINNKLAKNINYQDIKHININLQYQFYSGIVYDISLFNNLEYLSISLNSDIKCISKENIKIKLSENQYKNIKTLKINESKEIADTIKNIVFEPSKIYENLNELHIKEALLNKIKFNSKTLKKLNLLYDYRDKIYTIEYIVESINNILEQYLSLNYLNVSFYYILNELDSYTFEQLIREISNFLFISIQNIENLSFNFYNYNNRGYIYEKSKCCIKKINNKRSKYIIKGNVIPYNIFEPYLDKIEEIDLSFKYCEGNVCNLYIEENSSISAITKIRIKRGNNNILYIPIKSFSSLNVLQLEVETIKFIKDFPLFSKDSSIKFNNLEYLELSCDNAPDLIINNIDFKNIPNLRYLSIINKNAFNTVFSYHTEIISKCSSLKKLHTLIIDDNSYNSNLNEVNQFYSIYPELKNTNIKFCKFSKFLKK